MIRSAATFKDALIIKVMERLWQLFGSQQSIVITVNALTILTKLYVVTTPRTM
jgi:histidyl-tRNA synthetase